MIQKKDIQLCTSSYDKHASIYTDTNIVSRAAILYFHGGGLLYGSRNDLPDTHIRTLVKTGYTILSFDYPLAPAAKIDLILEDVCASIQEYCTHSEQFTDTPLPYFLWGRSAGAYLCLLAAAFGEFTTSPSGILSFYGYGFLCDSWFHQPSDYYLSVPEIPAVCLSKIPSNLHADGDLSTHFSTYVYARQSGKWLDLIYEGRLKFFYPNYTLRTYPPLPCPLFCAHSTNDTDVPFAEFIELTSHYTAVKYINSGSMHDFDRDEAAASTGRLLEATLGFLEANI